MYAVYRKGDIMILSKINKTLRTVAVAAAAVVLIAKLMEKEEDKDLRVEELKEDDSFQGEEFDDIW